MEKDLVEEVVEAAAGVGTGAEAREAEPHTTATLRTLKVLVGVVPLQEGWNRWWGWWRGLAEVMQDA